MTDPVETIVCEPVPSSLASTAIAMPFTRIGYGGTEFLDESWAEEFDRRLAAWESDSAKPVIALSADVVSESA
jgi:hypothetical protein